MFELTKKLNFCLVELLSFIRIHCYSFLFMLKKGYNIKNSGPTVKSFKKIQFCWGLICYHKLKIPLREDVKNIQRGGGVDHIHLFWGECMWNSTNFGGGSLWISLGFWRWVCCFHWKKNKMGGVSTFFIKYGLIIE